MEFFWVIEGHLAGCSLPETSDDIRELDNQKIRHLVSFTECKWVKKLLKGSSIKHYCITIEDFAIPSPQQIKRFLELIEKNINGNEATVVHCFAGCGRTGTMLALYFVHRGNTPKEAIARVRKVRPCSLETKQQIDLITEYYEQQFTKKSIKLD